MHPGYGFLSENEDFAEICEAHGLAFIGPSKECIARMGNKIEAKKIAKEAGCELIPGSPNGVSPEDPELFKIAWFQPSLVTPMAAKPAVAESRSRVEFTVPSLSLSWRPCRGVFCTEAVIPETWLINSRL